MRLVKYKNEVLLFFVVVLSFIIAGCTQPNLPGDPDIRCADQGGILCESPSEACNIASVLISSDSDFDSNTLTGTVCCAETQCIQVLEGDPTTNCASQGEEAELCDAFEEICNGARVASSEDFMDLSDNAGAFCCIGDCSRIEGLDCEFNEVYWLVNNQRMTETAAIAENQQVELIVRGSGCYGLRVNFEVRDEDVEINPLALNQPNYAIFSSNGIASTTWITEFDTTRDIASEPLGDVAPEFYFTAILDEFPATNLVSNDGTGILEVHGDSDGDLVFDENDRCPNTAHGELVGQDGCRAPGGGTGVCEFLGAHWYDEERINGLGGGSIWVEGTRLLLGVRNRNCASGDVRTISLYEDDGPEGPDNFDQFVTSFTPSNLEVTGEIIFARWTGFKQAGDLQEFSSYYFVVEPADTALNTLTSFVINLDDDGDQDKIPDALDQCPNTLPRDANKVTSNGCAPGDTDAPGGVDFTPNDGICEDGFIGESRAGIDTGVDNGERYTSNNWDCRRCVRNNFCNDGRDAISDSEEVGGGLDFGEDELNCQDCVDFGGGETGDEDGDGVPDERDRCPNTFFEPEESREVVTNPNHQYYGCKIDDWDEDGVGNANDNCPNTSTGIIVDSNGCESGDDDGDGVPNGFDRCPNTRASDIADVIRNAGDSRRGCPSTDLDGDGVYDINEPTTCLNTPIGVSVNAQGCSVNQITGSGDETPEGETVCQNGITAEIGNCEWVVASGPAAEVTLACGGNMVANSIEISNFDKATQSSADFRISCCDVIARCA